MLASLFSIGVGLMNEEIGGKDVVGDAWEVKFKQTPVLWEEKAYKG